MNRNPGILVAATGDTHGRLSALYEGILKVEEQVGRTVDLVCHVGDYGIWPDENNLDKATRNREIGEFPEWYRVQRSVPCPTVFIAGNHEDFEFLQAARPLLPGLTFLPWGEVIDYPIRNLSIRIGGVGGCWGPNDFGKRVLPGRTRRHYTRHDLGRIREQAEPRLDILLMHDAPAGELLDLTRARSGVHRKFSNSEGLAELIEDVQPRICFTGHRHIRTERTIAGVPTLGLNLVPHPGSLVLFEFDPGQDPVWIAENTRRIFEEIPDLNSEEDPLAQELARMLGEWRDATLKDRGPLSREERKQAHALLTPYPWGTVLMVVLKGADPSDVVRTRIPPADRETILRRWQKETLPVLHQT